MLTAGLPAGPRTPRVIQTLRHWRDPVGFEEALLHRYGEPFTIRTHPVGPLVVVSDPASVQAVLTGDAGIFRAGEANGRILPIIDCESVLLADGEEHRQRRRLLAPAFRPATVEDLSQAVVNQTERMMHRWPVGRPFSLIPSLREITLQVILPVIMSVSDVDLHAELTARVRKMLGVTSIAALWLGRNRRGWWNPARVFEHHRRAIHRLVHRELRHRLRDPARVGSEDVLDLLIAGLDIRDEARASQRICDEIVALLIAGHETTSIALGWLFERVVRHPAVLHQAQVASSGDDRPYLDALVRESLRIRPPLVDIVRRLAQPVVLAGHPIPAGAIVMTSIPLVHRRPEVYRSPELFRPERFLAHRPSPVEWVPFGGGRRRCLGADLALMEMRSVVQTVLAHTELEAARPEAEKARLLGTALVPSRRARVVVKATS